MGYRASRCVRDEPPAARATLVVPHATTQRSIAVERSSARVSPLRSCSTASILLRIPGIPCAGWDIIPVGTVLHGARHIDEVEPGTAPARVAVAAVIPHTGYVSFG